MIMLQDFPIQYDGVDSNGWFLYLNDCNDPYTMEMSSYLPDPSDPSREKCKLVIVFHYI